MKFFVLIHHQRGWPMMLTEEDGFTAAEFPDVGAAAEAAWNNPHGEKYGFTVIRWEDGIVEVC